MSVRATDVDAELDLAPSTLSTWRGLGRIGDTGNDGSGRRAQHGAVGPDLSGVSEQVVHGLEKY